MADVILGDVLEVGRTFYGAFAGWHVQLPVRQGYVGTAHGWMSFQGGGGGIKVKMVQDVISSTLRSDMRHDFLQLNGFLILFL